MHYELIIPFGKFLSNKLINSTSFEAVIYTWEVILIFLDVFPINPSHVTDHWLLVKQNGLIEILLFFCMKPIANYSPPPHSIGIRLSPQSQSSIFSDVHVFSHRMGIIVVWYLGFQFLALGLHHPLLQPQALEPCSSLQQECFWCFLRESRIRGFLDSRTICLCRTVGL